MKKALYIISVIMSVIYSLIYASLGGFIGNEGAMSKIGLTHPVLFAIWGVITSAVLFWGIIEGFSKTKYKFYIYLILIAAVGMMLTISFDFDYSKHSQYMLHCIGSMTFSVVSGITVFLLFLLTGDYIFAVVCGGILILDLTFLIIYKETAFIELMPIFAGYIMLTIHNTRRERDVLEVK